MTDFENAAFTVFVVPASRVILYYNLNLVPRSPRWTRTCGGPTRATRSPPRSSTSACRCARRREEDGAAAAVEMTASEVLMGNGKAYKGLVPMIMAYLDRIGADGDTRAPSRPTWNLSHCAPRASC